MWKRVLLATAMVSVQLCSISFLLAQPTAEELAKDPALFLNLANKTLKWEEPAKPAHLIGPIYFVGTRGLSVFFITTSEGHIIINTGMPGSGPMIEKSIQQLGFDPKQIKLLLTSHAHVDHVGGHAYLQKLSGAKVAVVAKEKELLESGGQSDFHYGGIREFAFAPAQVDRILADGEEIKLGKATLTALLTPGHTRGSMTFVMKIHDGGQDLVVVFPNGTGINPGYRLTKQPSYPGIADDYRHTLNVLESLRPDVWLYPHNEGYGFAEKLERSKDEQEKAWIDPEGYKKWVAAQREKLTATIATEAAE